MKLNYVLKAGPHHPGSGEYCLMEAVAHELGQPHTAMPGGVSRVLTAYGMRLNDLLSDEDRQLLVPIIPLFVVSLGGPLSDLNRTFIAVDYGVRKIAPIVMRLSSTELSAEADRLAHLPPIIGHASAETAPRYDFVKSALSNWPVDAVREMVGYAMGVARNPRAASAGDRAEIVALCIECLKTMCEWKPRQP